MFIQYTFSDGQISHVCTIFFTKIVYYARDRLNLYIINTHIRFIWCNTPHYIIRIHIFRYNKLSHLFWALEDGCWSINRNLFHLLVLQCEFDRKIFISLSENQFYLEESSSFGNGTIYMNLCQWGVLVPVNILLTLFQLLISLIPGW